MHKLLLREILADDPEVRVFKVDVALVSPAQVADDEPDDLVEFFRRPPFAHEQKVAAASPL